MCVYIYIYRWKNEYVFPLQRLPLHLSVVAIEKGAFWSPSTPVANITLLYIALKMAVKNRNDGICHL